MSPDVTKMNRTNEMKLVKQAENEDDEDNSAEPDVITDDVQLRSIRDANANAVTDPEPKFGIPKQPLFPGCSAADYLHATPDAGRYRSTFNAMRNPDVVLDDLAFRNLRRDANLSDPAHLGIVRDPNAEKIVPSDKWRLSENQKTEDEEKGPFVFYPSRHNAVMQSLSHHVAEIIRKQASRPQGGDEDQIITYGFNK